MIKNADLLAAFQYHHRNATRRYVNANCAKQGPAKWALEMARADIAAGRKRHPQAYHKFGASWNGARVNGKQWIESPASVGLRFVGYCDKLIDNINHTGWFTDEYQDNKMRGVVYQLPARNSLARYVAGHDNEDNGSAENGGPAYVDFSNIYEGEPLGFAAADYSDHYGAHRDAAYAADSFAEREAEQAREYNTAWQAGLLWAETKAELADDRTSVRQLLAERRQAKAAGESYPTICATLERAIRNALGDIESMRDKLKRLAEGSYEERGRYLGFYTGDATLRDAFNDGAGETVLA